MLANISFKLGSKYDWKGAVPIIRYALGAALILAFALGSAHLLSFLAPVIALSFLSPNSKPMSLKTASLFIVLLIVLSTTGVVFSRLFLGYPLVFMPLLALSILYILYTKSINPQFKTWLLISLLLIPLMSTFSLKLGELVAISLILNGAIGALMSWYIFKILTYYKPFKSNEAKTENIDLPDQERFNNSLRSLVVILPVVISFYIYQWAGAVVIMIFVAILSMNPATANFKTGKFMIVANLAGGLIAILAFNLFTIVPELTFLILITFLVGLYIGQKVYSDKPTAPLYSTAFSTYILVLGSVTTSTEGDASTKVWTRIAQIGVAVIYVVIAFGLYNHFFKSKTNTQNE